MESNGKRVDRAGNSVSYATCPVLWGAEGTPSQHSFHQLLHQGTQSVPCDFIDIASNQILSANLRAQADALAFGSADGQYPGNRASSVLFLEKMNPRNLGRLLALYEHKVFVQGIIWNLNSFDQPGVELGKAMAKKILSGGK
jgi:glucose-6-phosphate isomerase